MRKKNSKKEKRDKEEDYITITVDNDSGENIERKGHNTTRKNARIGNSGKRSKKDNKKNSFKTKNNENKGFKNWKKWSKKKKIGVGILLALLVTIILLVIIFSVYIVKAKGNIKDAVLNVATDIVGDQDPIFVLVLGVSEDISSKLTDTIMLCGYNPSTQKAFMFSIPRDTYVGTNESYANGYDKINAKYQKSAETTVETVELMTGINIDYYVIVRNISITSIFECIGSIDFDVPINMNYDDPTQDLHIHLEKGYQTLEPNQIEQLLRFRHNNDGTSYPSSYGDNDYGRMRTQREFIKAVLDQMISVQNISKLKDIASMVYTNLQTNMSGYKVLDYVPHALKFSTSNLRSEQLPGASSLINELWFYKINKKETRGLIDELMIYLEIDENKIGDYYKYADDIKGVKSDENYVAEEIVIEEEETTTTKKKKTNTSVNNSVSNTSKSNSNSISNTNTVKNTVSNTTLDNKICTNHNYVIISEKKADCTSSGSITYRCSICGNEYSDVIEPLGHSYSNGVCTRCNKKCEHNYKLIDSVKPTCVTPGSETYKCSICAKEYSKKINALGHNYINGVCTRCKEKDPDYVAKPSTNEVTDVTENVIKNQ